MYLKCPFLVSLLHILENFLNVPSQLSCLTFHLCLFLDGITALKVLILFEFSPLGFLIPNGSLFFCSVNHILVSKIQVAP